MNALITTMMKIVVCMAIGFLLRKINLLSEAAIKGFSALIVHVTAPCLLFASIVTMDHSEFQNAVTLLWAGVIVYVVLVVLAVLITRLLRVPTRSRGVYQAALIFGNVSFLGIPLAQSLYGAVGVFYIAVLNIHFNLLFFSYGNYLIMSSGEQGERFTPRKLLNSGLISIVLAMIIFFLGIRLPEVILSPIEFTGSITSPLSMIVIGCSTAGYSLKDVFRQKKLYLLSALRLLIYPIAAYYAFRLFLGNNLLTQILSIYIGMPTASVVGMTAIAYNADSESSTSCVAMTTIFSLATIPILYLVMKYL
ncbi:MAG: AEC family transporter [Parasporobacterium sp.]|nr:AEC family transporter [Parasporobacterium sp.]